MYKYAISCVVATISSLTPLLETSMATLVEADGDGCQCASPVESFDLTDRNNRFIIDGIITLPIALYGFLVFPDVPATTKAFYLSKEVRRSCELALS